MHKRFILIALALIAIGATRNPANAASAADLEKEYTAKIAELLPGMGASELVKRRDPQQALEKMCFEVSAPGKDTERKALCKAMLASVGADAAKPARIWLLRKIEPLGRGEVVAGLAKLMQDSDADVRECARRALANNSAPKAAAAFRDELATAKDAAWKVALINALGFRKDADSVNALAKLAGDGDKAIACAAIAALGDIASEAAMKSLADLRKNSRADVQSTVIDASLRGAEQLAARGNKPEAVAIYESFAAAAEPEAIRMAGIHGLAAVKGADALPELLKLIEGDDVHIRLVAARAAESIPGEDVTKGLIGATGNAKPAAQAALLEVLGNRGDAAAMPIAMKLAESPDHDVRVAAAGALMRVGDQTSLRVLAALLAKGADDEEREAARQAMIRLRGEKVDAEVIAAMEGAEPGIRAALLKIAAARQIPGAVPAMFAAATDPDEGIRVTVLSSLGTLAKESDLPKLVDVLVNAEGDSTRKAGEDAVVALCQRMEDKDQRVAPVVAAVAKASPAGQASLVRVLGRLQGNAALTAIRSVAKSDNAGVKSAVAEAYSKWGPVQCTTWLVSGPYKKDGTKGLDLIDTSFPPEQSDGKAEWKPLKNKKKQAGRYELHEILKQNECCCYVKTTVVSDHDGDAMMLLGSDDGVKAWVNGQVVHSFGGTRAADCEQDKVKVKLKKGENHLLLKITQGGSDWAFCCGFKAADGGPIDGLKFVAE